MKQILQINILIVKQSFIETMKKLFSFVLFSLFFALSACTTIHVHHHHHKHKKVPPGHAKKMSGEKSAKKHAHEQKKKKKD